MPGQVLKVACIATLAYSAAGAAEQPVSASRKGQTIGVAVGSPQRIEFDVHGNILAECVSESGECAAATIGDGQGAPSVLSFSRTDEAAVVRAGDSVSLAWSSQNALACVASVLDSPPGTAPSWSGARQAANASGEWVTLPAQGQYEFGLRCFNEIGGSPVTQVSLEVAEGQIGGNCTAASDPLIQPVGWARRDVDWQTIWSSPDGHPQAVFPSSVSFPVPIGARKGGYTVVEFVAPANVSADIFWDASQGRPQDGFIARPATDMAISISPCPGDVRAAKTASHPERSLRPACRLQSWSGGIVWSTRQEFENSPAVCYLEPGRTYYMNVIAADVSDGLTPGEHTCAPVPVSASECNVQARHTRIE